MIFHGGRIKKVFIASRRQALKEKGGVKMTLQFQASLPRKVAISLTKTGEWRGS